MGVRTGTLRDTKVEAYNQCITKATNLADAYKRVDNTNIWKMIDYSIELCSLHHYRSSDIGKIWREAFEGKNPNSEDIDNNNYTIMFSRLSQVGTFFALGSARSKGLYEKYKNKCGIHSIYYKVREIEKKAMKGITEKEEAMKNPELMDEEQPEPEQSKTETPNKKEETKSWTKKGFNLDKELAKQMKELYMGEPQKFFLMIARIISADTSSTSPKWKTWRSAANQEMKAYEKELAL